MAKQAAETIRTQLGGRQFDVMTGAKDFLFGISKAGCPFLSFKLGRGANRGINWVMITVAADDTYEMLFVKRSRSAAKADSTIETRTSVYADQLRGTFTAASGLYTSL